MAEPIALIQPSGSRNRTGPVTVTPSASNVDVTGDSWRLFRGLGSPSLLLSPDGSRDVNGPVEPTVGSGIDIIAGQYGQAWLHTEADNSRVDMNLAGRVTRQSGTMLARMRFGSMATTGTQLIASVGGTTSGGAFRIYAARISTSQTPKSLQFSMGSPLAEIAGGNPNMLPDDTWVVFAATWESGSATAYINGIPVGSGLFSVGTSDPEIFYSVLSGDKLGQAHEGVLFYQTDKPASEIARISQMPRRWEWGPDGTLTVPLTASPASVIVRHRTAGVAVTERAVLQDGAGTFGEHGTLSHDGTTLTVGTERESEVVGLIAYEDIPGDADVARIGSLDEWEWGPNGSITLPVGQPPRIITITTPDTVYNLDGDATSFGDHGTITHTDGEVIIGTTGRTDIVSVMIDGHVPDPQSNHIASMSLVSWGSITPSLGGVRITAPATGEIAASVDIPATGEIAASVTTGETPWKDY